MHHTFSSILCIWCSQVASRRKVALMYALLEPNMPAAVPSDCVSPHSSLILKVILGSFSSDYSSGRANNQMWACVHLWETSAGNTTKVDAPGTPGLIKMFPLPVLSSSFFFLIAYFLLYQWIRQIEPKINDGSVHFRFPFLCLSNNAHGRRTASIYSPDVFWV